MAKAKTLKLPTQPVLGAQLFTLRDHCKTITDLAATLKKVAEIGYTAVQVSGIGPMDYKEVAKVLADSGLTCACTHVGWERFLKEIDAVIDQHKAWKCDHPAIGGLWGGYQTADGLKLFLDELPPVAERLAKEGMDFSYHNHNHEFRRLENGKTWLASLYEQTSPAQLKAEIDTYWVVSGGADPAAWIRKLAGREPLLHLKDMSIAADNTQHMAEIGEGNLNWPEILKAAVEGGVRWYLVEQDNCYDRSPFDCLATSYRNLTAMGLK